METEEKEKLIQLVKDWKAGILGDFSAMLAVAVIVDPEKLEEEKGR